MDWFLSFLIVIVNFLLSKKLRWAWLVMIGSALLWIYYAISLSPPQYGLIPASVLNIIVAISGYKNWKKLPL